MKIDPATPLDEDSSSKSENRGCNATVFGVILAVLAITMLLWFTLWAGGTKRAQQEPVKPTTTEQSAR